MSAAPHPQITHESETQRQYPRLPLPSRAVMNGKEFEIKNLSAGGVAICGVGAGSARGKPIAFDLKLPFKGFFLSVGMNAEVLYYNAAEKVLGCRFINQGQEQISFLNHAIRSFISGDLITSENILNIAARNNFTKARSHANSNATIASFRRQIPGLLLVLVTGILIAMLIGGNLYNSIFIVKADDAAVMGPTIAVRASVEGVYHSRLDSGLVLVQQNQVLGTITPENGGSTITLQSPCDCYIAKTYVSSDEMVSRGGQIMSLLPTDSRPWILAEIDPAQAKKIGANSSATISVFGSSVSYTGHILSMESPLSDDRANGSKAVLMRIGLEQKLPVDFVNRLAAVTFAIR
jgi:alginate biosynthesis protein Alg44